MLELWLAIHYLINKAVVDEARIVSPPPQKKNITSDTCVTDLCSFVRTALYLHSSKRCFVSFCIHLTGELIFAPSPSRAC